MKPSVDIRTMPEKEAIEVLMKYHNMGREEAEFVYALERGEITGDLEVVDDDES